MKKRSESKEAGDDEVHLMSLRRLVREAINQFHYATAMRTITEQCGQALAVVEWGRSNAKIYESFMGCTFDALPTISLI